MKGYIYRISSKTIPNFYIGSTSQVPRKRWNNHLREFKKGIHSCKPLQEIFNQKGKEDIYFSIEKEVEVENRIELYDIEQETIDYYLEVGAPISNTNFKVIKGDSTGTPKITNYEDYRNIRIFYEFDEFIYPLAEYFNMDESSLSNLIAVKTYLEYNDEYVKENLTEEEKIKIYLTFTKKLLQKVNVSRKRLKLTTFQGILILSIMDLINPMRDHLYKYVNVDPTEDLMRPYREKFQYTLKAAKIVNSMSIIDKINFILDNISSDTIFEKGKLTTPAFLTYFYVKYSRDNKIKMRKELSQELNISEPNISNYSSNSPRNKGIIELHRRYLSISEKERTEIYELIIKNKFLLPRNSGKNLETPK